MTDVVVPDGIEPVEQWRTWNFDGRRLTSIHSRTEWTPGEPLHASCDHGDRWTLTIVRGGQMTLEQAQQWASSRNQSGSIWSGPTYWTPVPNVEPPPFHGYAVEVAHHKAPDAGCSCGIYAAARLSDCPPGPVAGKVKLWGTIVPGEYGARAEYAYPSELRVPASLADDPGILAYGVPVVVDETIGQNKALALAGLQQQFIGANALMIAATALNLGAGTWNLLRILGVLP
jgi:hypothetical protein